MLMRPTYCRLIFGPSPWTTSWQKKRRKKKSRKNYQHISFCCFFLLSWIVPNCKKPSLACVPSTATTPQWPHLLADWVKPGVRVTCWFVSHLWSQIVSSMPISSGVPPDLECAPTPCRQRHSAHALNGAAAVLHIAHLSWYASARRT